MDAPRNRLLESDDDEQEYDYDESVQQQKDNHELDNAYARLMQYKNNACIQSQQPLNQDLMTDFSPLKHPTTSQQQISMVEPQSLSRSQSRLTTNRVIEYAGQGMLFPASSRPELASDPELLISSGK